MTSNEKTCQVIDALNSLGVGCMLTGSLASNMYGVVRTTLDADFVVQVKESGIQQIASRLADSFTLDPQASFETVTMTIRYVLTSADRELKVELFLLSDDPYDQERFRRRREVQFEGHTTYVPSPEDVIIAKLLWYRRARRRKDFEDVRNVLNVQGPALDDGYIRYWCGQHQTLEFLESARQKPSDQS